MNAGLIAGAVGVWAVAWAVNSALARIAPPPAWVRLAVPLIFGATVLILWEWGVRGFGVPEVLLPPPSRIAAAFAGALDTLWADFRQTVLRATLIGYAAGCGLGVAVAIAIDRSPFMQRGLMPIGTLASALPIVGIAPIMVMWFGFDWPSKAAVVVAMTVFPMLTATLEGLAAAERAQVDLMRSYGAGYWQTLWRLRLSAAAPFIFTGLKICTTLALIGAIVAEFFGTPTVGMGFRIATEVGRLNIAMVWAEIAVAAVTGSVFYGLVAGVERAVTFWHPSQRAPG